MVRKKDSMRQAPLSKASLVHDSDEKNCVTDQNQNITNRGVNKTIESVLNFMF